MAILNWNRVFEAPPESFHMRVQTVLQSLQESENGDGAVKRGNLSDRAGLSSSKGEQ